MDPQTLRGRLTGLRSQRPMLVDLLGRPNLSEMLLGDVRCALEELDDLIAEFDRTFSS